jgi:hypothetical protein
MEAFREDAERSILLPDFEAIAATGRRRRLRRRAAAGSVAACVLAASGFLAAAYDRSGSPEPAEDPHHTSLMTPYPGLTMTALPAGRYAARPFADPALPDVRFTLPAGWNAWVGPNRFEGLDEVTAGDAKARKDVLESEPDWLLGMVPLDPQWIAQPGCAMVDVTGADTATVVRALTVAPRLTVVLQPERTTLTGHRAVHLRLQEAAPRGTCRQGVVMRAASAGIRYLGPGTTYDAWVVDVGDRSLLVWAAWTAATPRSEVQDLLGIIDSVEVHDR